MKNFLALICIAALSANVSAHHGANSEYDTSIEIAYTGIVTDLGLVNPHSYVYFDKTDENGNYVLDEAGNRIGIHCEMLSWTALRRAGWTTEMFKPGTAIKVGGNPSRKEEYGCVLETMVLNDGPELTRFSHFEETEPKANLDRTALTAWGDPNIGGDWAAEGRTARPAGGEVVAEGGAVVVTGAAAPAPAAGGSGRRGGVQLTEIGQAASEIMAAKIASGEMDDNRLNCMPRDFFQDWVFNWIPNRIVQEQDKIFLTYGFMDRDRTIHMDITEHPAVLAPTLSGHSIGHWEEEVLIVDTVGFTENFRWQGNAVSFINSEQYHTVERFTLDNENGSLTREYEAADALYWEEGYKRTGQDVVAISNLSWEVYSCNDLTVE